MIGRRAEILEAVIAQFIETGLPVSSAQLFEEYDFGIRPAMIRAELQQLENSRYLEQPHHSAGRVPANRGYEFYAARMMEREHPVSSVRVAHQLQQGVLHSLRGMAELISQELGCLGVVHECVSRHIYKEGLPELVDAAEWDTKREVRRILEDVEQIDERLEDAAGEMADKNFLEIFIGRKSPVTHSDALAVMMGDYSIGGHSVYILAVGSRRMDYEKAAELFKELKKIAEPKR